MPRFLLALAPALRGGSFGVSALLPLLALTVFFEVPSQAAAPVLIASERPTWASVFQASTTVLQVAALLVPLLLGMSLTAAMASLAAYACLKFVTFLVVMGRAVPPGAIRFRRSGVVEQLVFTLPLSLSIATTALNRQIDKWYVAAWDSEFFGSYVLAAQEVPIVSVVPFAMGAVVSTRIVHACQRGDSDRVLAYWHSSTSRATLFVPIAAIGLVVTAPEIIGLLFTDTYLAAVIPFQIYAVILLHRVGEYGMMLRAAGDTRSIWLASVTLLACNAAFSLPLTIAFGMVGAAVGTLAANLVAWLFVLTRIARAIDIGTNRILPWRMYAITILTACIAGACAWSAGELIAVDGHAAGVALKLIVLLLAYLALVRALGLTRRLPEVPTDDAQFTDDLITRPR